MDNKKYSQEVRERWGDTQAYAEYAAKADHNTAQAAAGLDAIMGAFAACKQSGAQPQAEQAQALVDKLQAYITAHYYRCTDEILAGLGKMYVADERFRENIDKHGEGTAEFIKTAINCR
ncbi:MAG: TipAS antibiotic-recognition domain-containing protein [Clostridia bacterium]|nr:TipAS antibiotic-recognition domain-containing protein [Clostridia bacterium]